MQLAKAFLDDLGMSYRVGVMIKNIVARCTCYLHLRRIYLGNSGHSAEKHRIFGALKTLILSLPI